MDVKDEVRLMGVNEFHNETIRQDWWQSCGGAMKFVLLVCVTMRILRVPNQIIFI